MANKENYGSWAESGKAEVKTSEQKEMEEGAEQAEPSLEEIIEKSGYRHEGPQDTDKNAEESRRKLAEEEAKLQK